MLTKLSGVTIENARHDVPVTNVAVNETIAGVAGEVWQGFGVSAVGEEIRGRHGLR